MNLEERVRCNHKNNVPTPRIHSENVKQTCFYATMRAIFYLPSFVDLLLTDYDAHKDACLQKCIICWIFDLFQSMQANENSAASFSTAASVVESDTIYVHLQQICRRYGTHSQSVDLFLDCLLESIEEAFWKGDPQLKHFDQVSVAAERLFLGTERKSVYCCGQKSNAFKTFTQIDLRLNDSKTIADAIDETFNEIVEHECDVCHKTVSGEKSLAHRPTVLRVHGKAISGCLLMTTHFSRKLQLRKHLFEEIREQPEFPYKLVSMVIQSKRGEYTVVFVAEDGSWSEYFPCNRSPMSELTSYTAFYEKNEDSRNSVTVQSHNKNFKCLSSTNKSTCESVDSFDSTNSRNTNRDDFENSSNNSTTDTDSDNSISLEFVDLCNTTSFNVVQPSRTDPLQVQSDTRSDDD